MCQVCVDAASKRLEPWGIVESSMFGGFKIQNEKGPVPHVGRLDLELLPASTLREMSIRMPF